MNYERTINGLTKHTARQLGEAYFSLAEAFGLIDDLTLTSGQSASQMRKLCSEIDEYNSRARQMKQENERLKQENEALKCFMPQPAEQPEEQEQEESK